MPKSMLSWSWEPGLSVGPFRFGEDSGKVIREFGLVKLDPDVPSAYWDTYEIPDHESRIMVQEAKLSGVLCCDHLILSDKELLGMPLSWLRVLLGTEDRFEPNVGLDCAAHYDRLGATFWIVDKRVDTVSTWGPWLDDVTD